MQRITFAHRRVGTARYILAIKQASRFYNRVILPYQNGEGAIEQIAWRHGFRRSTQDQVRRYETQQKRSRRVIAVVMFDARSATLIATATRESRELTGALAISARSTEFWRALGAVTKLEEL